MKTQQQIFWESHRRIADANDAFMDLINCKENPMTRQDLESLIRRNPARYGRFSGFLDKPPEEQTVMKTPTNEQIASCADLWDEYYNVSATPENEFSSLTHTERLEMLKRDYPDGNDDIDDKSGGEK